MDDAYRNHEEIICTYNILVAKSEGMRSLSRRLDRLEDNLNWIIKK
jgi:hypothetical protein